MKASLLLAIFAFLCGHVSAQDVVIYGGTPGGIAAAISAARLGRAVTLVEYNDHLGGMTTSGLGKSDIENRAMIGGLFNEFVSGVHLHPLSHIRDLAGRRRDATRRPPLDGAPQGLHPQPLDARVD